MSNESITGHPQPRKLQEVREALEKLLPACTSPAGEDYPAAWRWCVYCQVVEGGSEFHKPDCPVVKLRRLMLLVQWY